MSGWRLVSMTALFHAVVMPGQPVLPATCEKPWSAAQTVRRCVFGTEYQPLLDGMAANAAAGTSAAAAQTRVRNFTNRMGSPVSGFGRQLRNGLRNLVRVRA